MAIRFALTPVLNKHERKYQMATTPTTTPTITNDQFFSHISEVLDKDKQSSLAKAMPKPKPENLVKVKRFISAVTGRPYYMRDLWASRTLSQLSNGNIIPTGSATFDAPSLPDEAKTTVVFNDALGLRHASHEQLEKYGFTSYMMVDITSGNLYPDQKS